MTEEGVIGCPPSMRMRSNEIPAKIEFVVALLLPSVHASDLHPVA